MLCWGVVLNHGPSRVENIMGMIPIGPCIGFFSVIAPLILAFVLWACSDKMAWNWPFQKEGLCTAYALNVLPEFILGIAPLCYTISLACS